MRLTNKMATSTDPFARQMGHMMPTSSGDPDGLLPLSAEGFNGALLKSSILNPFSDLLFRFVFRDEFIYPCIDVWAFRIRL